MQPEMNGDEQYYIIVRPIFSSKNKNLGRQYNCAEMYQ